MIRSIWKGPYINKLLYNEINQFKQLNLFRTSDKSSTIISEMVYKKIEIYNGRFFHKLQIVDDMVGHKLGEFVQTKKRCVYRNKKGNKKIKNKK
jgi:small subunit ribosomal protein S19